MRLPWLAALLVAGCTRDLRPAGPGGGDEDDPSSDTDQTTTTAPCAGDQWDPWALVEPHHCDDDGYEAMVATSHFIGEFSYAGAAVTGFEHQALYAGPEWLADGGQDCRTTWQITGTKGEAVDCPSCAYSLVLQAHVDTARTTCPQMLWGASSFTVTYNVRERTDDYAVFTFATSGETLAEGCSDSAGSSYVTEARCFYF